MKVLMITPGVDENEDILGFTASWIRALAKRVDMLYVITPYLNPDTPLPENSIVYGLNEKSNKLTKYLYFSRVMIRLSAKREVDVIFCHIGPNSVLWAAPWAKLLRIPIVTWYAHGHVSLRLRIAHFLADRIVTSTEEGFRIKSDKVIITGQGIGTDRFKPAINPERRADKNVILSLGRISPIKDYETLVKTADILINEKGMKNIEFLIVGGVPEASQEGYYQRILRMVEELRLADYTKFVGSVPHGDTVKYYQACDIFVSTCCIGGTSEAGGFGKTVLEAMACGKPVVVCGEPYRELLRPYDELCLFKPQDPVSMAEKLANLILNERIRPEIGKLNRQKIVDGHSVSQLADKLVNIFAGLSKHKETGVGG